MADNSINSHALIGLGHEQLDLNAGIYFQICDGK